MTADVFHSFGLHMVATASLGDSQGLEESGRGSALTLRSGPEPQANEVAVFDDPTTRGFPAVQAIPVIHFAERAATRSFQAYAAMQRMAADDPSLADNPVFRGFIKQAFDRFNLAFERAR